LLFVPLIVTPYCRDQLANVLKNAAGVAVIMKDSLRTREVQCHRRRVQRECEGSQGALCVTLYDRWSLAI
jgi:hypothetical protein